MMLFIGRFFAGIIPSGIAPANAALREDNTYQLREDGTYELRE